MPRAQESIEARILRYFRTAPADAVRLLLGLVKDAVRERGTVPLAAVPAPKPKSQHKAKAAYGMRPKKSHHKQATAADAPKPRKRHRRSRGLPGTVPTEVEDFGSEK